MLNVQRMVREQIKCIKVRMFKGQDDKGEPIGAIDATQSDGDGKTD